MMSIWMFLNGFCIPRCHPESTDHYQTGYKAQDQNFHIIPLCVCADDHLTQVKSVSAPTVVFTHTILMRRH